MGAKEAGPDSASRHAVGAGPPSERLDSWKEIAAYFKRDIRTVQRWEKTEGLPVHRHMHGEQGSVYAYRAQLEAWWNNGHHHFGPLENGTTPLSPHAPAVPELSSAPVEGASQAVAEIAFASPVRKAWLWSRMAKVALILVTVTAAAVAGFLALRVPAPPKILGYTQLTSDGRPKVGGLFTDGSRLYFVELTPEGAGSLVSVPTAGGDTTAIAVPFRQFGLVGISTRRSELLLSTAGAAGQGTSLWTLPLTGGTPHRVGQLVVDRAAWSPDGERLAYASGRELYLAKSDGGDSRRVVALSDNIDSISWSPDGRTLRLAVDIPGRFASAFWDVAADGTGLHRVLPHWETAGGGAWAPGGSYFLFSKALTSGGRNRLWALRERQGFFRKGAREPVQLGLAAPIEFQSVVPSPDGKKIFAMGLQHRPELARYDARLKEFVPYLGGIAATWASFSRDGKWVAYLSLPQHALWRAKADGNQPVQLSFPPLEGDGLAWSPDGKHIALRARMPDKPWKVYLVPAEGGAPEPLTTGIVDEGIPTWSPDGKKIVFGDVPPVFGQDDGHHALHVVNVETREVSDLPDSKGLWTSRWSPDGRYVAALKITSQHLRLFDFTTQEWRELAAILVSDPTWSRDGKFIYFDCPSNPPRIYRVRVSDAKLARNVDLGGIALGSAWGCGLAPDDSPLITREVGFTEIYAVDIDLP